MWFTKKASPPVIAKRWQSNKNKVLYAIFIKGEGPVDEVAIPKSWSIIQTLCAKTCSEPLR